RDLPFEPRGAAQAMAAARAAEPDATRNERTPSKSTDPGAESESEPKDESRKPAEKSVIDQSMVQTDSASGPFKGHRQVRMAVAAIAVALIGAAGFLTLRSKQPARTVPAGEAQ